MTQQLIRPSVYLQAYSITDLWDTNNTHAHVSFYFILRLNFLRGWTDVRSNRDLSYISFLSKQGGKRRREKTEQSRESPSDTMSAVLNSPSTASSHILPARKHSVNRNPPFLTVLHDDPSPLFLVYSSHHVVSCLLMDSHWGCTCYSRLQRHRSDPTRLLCGHFMRAFTQLFGEIFTVFALAVMCVTFGISRGGDDESAWAQQMEKKNSCKARQKLKIMRSYGLQL